MRYHIIWPLRYDHLLLAPASILRELWMIKRWAYFRIGSFTFMFRWYSVTTIARYPECVNLVRCKVSVFRWYLYTILVSQSLFILILQLFDKSCMPFKIKERRDELFKLKPHCHASDLSARINCNKFIFRLVMCENLYQVYLFMVGRFLYLIFLHARPLANVLCVIYWLNYSYDSNLGLIMVSRHLAFSDHFTSHEYGQVEQSSVCDHRSFLHGLSLRPSPQWTGMVNLGVCFIVNMPIVDASGPVLFVV